MSIADGRAELLAIVRGEETRMDAVFRHGRIEYLIRLLESAHVPAQTVPFLQFTLQGEWELLYSNVLTPRRDTTLQIRMFQEIRPHQDNRDDELRSSGELRNRVAWRRFRTDLSEGPTTEGDLIVRCNYHLTTKGDLDVTLSEHLLLPAGDAIPSDPEELVAAFQRTLPFEVFDPNETLMKHLYVHPDIRIVAISGEVFHNVFNVFVRVPRGPLDGGQDKDWAVPRRNKSGTV